MWLHEQGYSYNGDAPITGLTRAELDKLQLGHIVKQEQEQEQSRRAKDPHNSHSESYDRRKRDLVNKYQEGA